MTEMSLDWPGAVAIVGSVVAIVVAASRFVFTGSRSLVDVDNSQQKLADRVQALEVDVARMTEVLSTVRTQLSEVRKDMKTLTARINDFIERFIASLEVK